MWFLKYGEGEQIVLDALPRKGFINPQQIARETGLAPSLVYYWVQNLECVSKVQIGVKKHKYFVKQRIDKWVWQKLCRYARQGRRVIKTFVDMVRDRQLKGDERDRLVNRAYKQAKT